MSFFEDLATALDNEGIESRVHDDVLFVPITSDLEIQFVEIDSVVPAANVYIAAADVDEDDDEFEAALVSVVFSVEDAVRTVAEHVATDQVVTVLRDLLEGTDDRIAELEFFQDPHDPHMVHAEVAENSELQVVVDVVDGEALATVTFVAFGESFDDLVDQAIDELWSDQSNDSLSDEDRDRLFYDVAAELTEEAGEVLQLGSYSDCNKLFDVLSVALENADDWEEQLAPLESAEADLESEGTSFESEDLLGDDDDLEFDDLDDEDEDEDA
ncbi:hypothetical protein ACQX19_01070 [Corynebacterium diphtheriae]